MRRAMRVLICGLASVALTSGMAMAGDIVVPPILARGAPSQTAANMTTLVASELEFTGEFDTVHQLATRPSQLGTNCLASSPCLAGIARTKGATSLIGGRVTKYGPEFEVALTFLENGKIARVVKKRMPTDPAAVADEIAFLVRHAVTGVDPAAKAEAEKVSGFEGGGIALMDDEEDEDDDDLLLAAPDVPASPDPMGDDDDDLFREDPSDDDDFGVAAGAVGGAAAIALDDPGLTDDFDPDAINFGGGSADDISFGSASGIIEVEDEDPIEPEPRYADDLDEGRATVQTPRQRAKRERATRERAPRERTPRARGPRPSRDGVAIDVTGRIGFAKFQFLNFLTYGVEAGLQVAPNMAVLAGLEAYSTRRSIPEGIELAEGTSPVQWNTLVPLSVAAVYRPEEGTLRPFAGGGLQVIPGYVKDSTSLAFGLRGLGGIDYAVSDTMSVSVSASAGFWAGSEWYQIQNLLNTGFSGQLGAGAVVRF